ncbi:UV excision repair protein Rad23, UBA-like, Ubiquitin-related domain protein [Artemisia annua]|uniref:UV excision repair protein Rad23, UBA-like, Ubiquitin-related domain protein n=1 Tax=Artemisia annua TaxID=35608 RepID=A0A2U1QKJ4_ARTAN|nr:UV excision repair protein Rad23, UBA-like, Ubiquitin-related domain protein [Artemisia annua]
MVTMCQYDEHTQIEKELSKKSAGEASTAAAARKQSRSNRKQIRFILSRTFKLSNLIISYSKIERKMKLYIRTKVGTPARFAIDVKLEDTGFMLCLVDNGVVGCASYRNVSNVELVVLQAGKVADVKKNIETVQGTNVYPAAQQELLHRGKVLEDATTLEEIGVRENSFIVLRLSKSNSAGEASTAAAAPKGIPEAAEVTPVAGVPPVPAVNPPVQAPQATRPAAAPPMGRSNRKQKKKVTTDKYGGKTTQQHERSLLHVEIQDLLTEALRSSNRHLQDEVAITKRLEGDLRKHGDYICISIMRACEILRSKDPNIFKKRGPRSIAQSFSRMLGLGYGCRTRVRVQGSDLSRYDFKDSWTRFKSVQILNMDSGTRVFIFIFLGEEPRPLSPPRVPSGFRTGTRVASGQHRYAGDVSRVRAFPGLFNDKRGLDG